MKVNQENNRRLLTTLTTAFGIALLQQSSNAQVPLNHQTDEISKVCGKALFELVNEYLSSQDIPQVTWSNQVYSAAYQHCLYMTYNEKLTYKEHVKDSLFTGETFSERLQNTSGFESNYYCDELIFKVPIDPFSLEDLLNGDAAYVAQVSFETILSYRRMRNVVELQWVNFGAAFIYHNDAYCVTVNFACVYP